MWAHAVRNPMLTARYTRIVGKWHARAVSVLVVAALAGSPALAVACEALCSDAPHSTMTAQDASHHHWSEDQGSARHAIPAADHAAAGHDHHQSSAPATASIPEPDARMNGSLAPECCSSPAQPGVSLAAVRADTNLLSTQPAVFLSVAIFDPLDCHAWGPIHASPPGAAAPARTTVVLRI
jgi:hypothetical protein